VRLHRIAGIFSLTLALVIGLSWPAQAQSRFGLKISGGLGTFLANEANEGNKGLLDGWATEFQVDYGYTASGKYKPFHLGFEAGVDLIFYLTPNVGLGIGGGYLESFSKSIVNLTKGSDTGTITSKPHVSAVPLRASLYLSLPLGTSASLVLQGGAGYYLAHYEDDFTIEEGLYWLDLVNKANATGIGFHGGLGVEVNFGPNFALVLEAQARSAVISGFEGTFEYSDSSANYFSEQGKLYFIKAVDPLGTFSIIEVYATPPSGADILDQHEAKIDLSGFSARAGFIFRF